MKKNLGLVASIVLLVAGCENWRSDRASSDEKRGASQSGIMKEPLGSQSQSSDPNQASSSRNVGQSGTTTELPPKTKGVPSTNSTETPK